MCTSIYIGGMWVNYNSKHVWVWELWQSMAVLLWHHNYGVLYQYSGFPHLISVVPYRVRNSTLVLRTNSSNSCGGFSEGHAIIFCFFSPSLFS